MTKLTVIILDKVIIKDGVALYFSGGTAEGNFDAVVTSQGHENKWAVQWDGATGYIEDSDSSIAHEQATESVANAYIAAFDAEIGRIKQEEKTTYLGQDADALARQIRNGKLIETDFEALSDRNISAEMTNYRQALRDLPDSQTNWNPSLSWDDETWEGSLVGVTWPAVPS